jgi:hypothetical protein
MLPDRRFGLQPERYVQFELKLVGKLKISLTKNNYEYKVK